MTNVCTSYIYIYIYICIYVVLDRQTDKRKETTCFFKVSTSYQGYGILSWTEGEPVQASKSSVNKQGSLSFLNFLMT